MASWDKSYYEPCDWTADGWPLHDEYLQRKADLLRTGLNVKLELDVQDDGFVSFTVKILTGTRLRDDTPHRLHISLCKRWEVSDALLSEIAEAWHNVETHLNIGWVGSGGTAYIEHCPFNNCPLVALAHQQGSYSHNCGLHISF